MPMKPASSSDNASGNPLARLLASAALKGQRRDRPALRYGRRLAVGVFWPKIVAFGRLKFRPDRAGRRFRFLALLNRGRPLMHKAIEVPQVFIEISIVGMSSVFSAPYLQSCASY
jgi:hypothetical protein